MLKTYFKFKEMFASIDKNEDDKLTYKEFKKMINPPDVPQTAKPHISAIGIKPHVFSPFASPKGITFRLEILFCISYFLGESTVNLPTLAQTPGINMLLMN